MIQQHTISNAKDLPVVSTTDPVDFRPYVAAYLQRRGARHTDPQAALIDMDGTLYNSMVNHTAAWHRMMSDLGVNTCQDEFYVYEGMTGAATIELLFQRELHRSATEEEKKEYYHRKTVYFNELPPVEVMPGAQLLIKELEEASLKRVLVTGSGQSSLINRLNADFPGGFSEQLRVTSRDVSHGKPHPEPYLRAMELAQVAPEQSIAIENAPLGVESAAKAGAFTVALTTGPIPVQEMTRAGADIVFASMPLFAHHFPRLLEALQSSDI